MKCICNTSAIHLCASVYQIHCAIHLQYILDCNTLCNTFVIHGDAFVFSQIYSKMPTGSRLMCNTMCTSTCDTLVLYNCAIHCVPLPVWYFCIEQLCNSLCSFTCSMHCDTLVLYDFVIHCHTCSVFTGQGIMYWTIPFFSV